MASVAMAAACVATTGGAATAHASTTCTWGGTPAAPTGTFTLRPGLMNFPSAGPLAFKATGELAGGQGCAGRMVYEGVFDSGATCLAATFHVKVRGLPGVVSAVGSADNLVPAPALLHDSDGRIVGTEIAQIVTAANAPNYTDCTTAEGFTWGTFSSVIELF